MQRKSKKNVVGHQRLKTKESQENSPIILLQLNTHHLTRETGMKKISWQEKQCYEAQLLNA